MYFHLSIFLIITLSFFSSSKVAGKPFSNNHRLPYDRVIIFGDSISDTGNFPAAKHYSSDTSLPPYNLFVPIGNPVNPEYYGNVFTIIHSDTVWHYPSRYFLVWATSPQKSYIDTHEKTIKSINWVEYFVFNALDNEDSPEPILIPSSKIHQEKLFPSKSTSLNYAWAGALTIDGFSGSNYKTITNIHNEQELYALRKNYYDEKTKEIAIPGIKKQVKMYLHDVDSGLVPANNNTAYLILIGGNDIAATFKNDLMHINFRQFHQKIGTTSTPGTIAKNVVAAIDELINKGNASHIYVLSLFDISKLPSVYHATNNVVIRWIIKKLMHNDVERYNKQLSAIFSQPKYKHVVKFLPVGKSINKLAQEAQFHNSVINGLTCVSNTKELLKPTDCNYSNKQTYFAWNESHLTTVVHQYFAYRVFKNIQENLQQMINIT